VTGAAGVCPRLVQRLVDQLVHQLVHPGSAGDPAVRIEPFDIL
jgi:hypothetical protein